MKYLAQRVLTGEWLHKSLPLSSVERVRALSGPGGITATINPELRQQVAPDGLRVIEEWATYLYAVNDAGRVTHGGLVTNCEYSADGLRINAPGFTTYPHGYIYDALRNWGPIQGTGTVADPETPRPDPIDIVHDLWEWIQAQDDSDLGVRFVGSSESTTTVGDYEEPYRLRWYELPDIGQAIDDLAENTPFDYTEEYAWTLDGSDVKKLLRLGFPRLGSKRTDLVFQQGVNVVLDPSVETNAEDFANFVIGIGKGDGPALRKTRGDAMLQDGRLRRVRVVTNKAVGSPARMANIAKRNLQSRSSTLDLTSVSVIDHPNARITDINPGDDIRVQVNLPAYNPTETFSVWVRVVSITQGDDDSTAVLSTQRSSAFTYVVPTDESGTPTAKPPPESEPDEPDEPKGHEPTMLRVYVCNMTVWQGRDKYVLRSLARRSDVLLLQETSNIDVDKLLPEGWRALQGPGPSVRGESTIAFRRSRVSLINDGDAEFGVVWKDGLTRWFRWARLADPQGNVGHFVTAHFPTQDAWNATMEKNVGDHLDSVPAGMPVIFGADVNQPRGPLAVKYNLDWWPRSANPKGIMLLGTRRCRVTKPGILPDAPGHDHSVPHCRVHLGG